MIIYHANCADGFAAAVVASNASGDKNLFPGFYGKEPPDVTDQDVVIVDFSYPRDTLIQMAQQARSILIIDHHKSAQERLVDLPDNVTAVFDMGHSGCVLTYLHYMKEKFSRNEIGATILNACTEFDIEVEDLELDQEILKNAPKVLLHIEDRDLWRFKMEHTREVMSALFSYPYDFNLWNDMINYDGEDYEQLITDGRAILRKHNKDIEEFISVAQHTLVIAAVVVPAINCSYMWGSDAAHLLSEGHPFAAYYYSKGAELVFGLRSQASSGIDVSEIAKLYGGGGHKHAAGFSIELDKMRILPFAREPEPVSVPQGWWDPDRVQKVVDAVRVLGATPITEYGSLRDVSCVFLARLAVVEIESGVLPQDSLEAKDALKFLELSKLPKLRDSQN